MLPYALFLVALTAAATYWATRRSPPAPPPAAPSAPASDTSASRVFMGTSHGYLLQLPPGYRVQSNPSDAQKNREVVYVFPEKTDPTTFSDEGLYGQLGILRLEVTPRDTEQGRITIDAVRSGVTASLKSRKALFTGRDAQMNGLPAFVVDISAPFPLVQAFLVGGKVLYILTGGVEQGAFADVLSSFHEVSEEAAPVESVPPETSPIPTRP